MDAKLINFDDSSPKQTCKFFDCIMTFSVLFYVIHNRYQNLSFKCWRNFYEHKL